MGDQRLAVTGYDTVPLDGARFHTTSAGLVIVDFAKRSRQLVDARATEVSVVGGMLLATSLWPDAGPPMGLVGYTGHGDRRYTLFAGQQVGIWATFGPRVYAHVPRARKHIHVVDAARGMLLGRRWAAPRLLDRDWIDY